MPPVSRNFWNTAFARASCRASRHALPRRNQEAQLPWRLRHGLTKLVDRCGIVFHFHQRQAQVVVGGIVVREELRGHTVFADRLRPAIEHAVRARAVEAIRPLARVDLHGGVEMWQRFGRTVLAHEHLTKVVARFGILGPRLSRDLKAP